MVSRMLGAWFICTLYVAVRRLGGKALQNDWSSGLWKDNVVGETVQECKSEIQWFKHCYCIIDKDSSSGDSVPIHWCPTGEYWHIAFPRIQKVTIEEDSGS